jgi:hypothetical protein
MFLRAEPGAVEAFMCGTSAKLRMLINVVVASALLGLLAPQVHSSEAQLTTAERVPSVAAPTSAPVNKSSVSPQSAPGLKIYIDPKTGEISKPAPKPAPVQPQQKRFEAATDSSTELRETPSPRPGGGVMVDLKGRFRSSLTATRGADGKLFLQHGSQTPTSSEKR